MIGLNYLKHDQIKLKIDNLSHTLAHTLTYTKRNHSMARCRRIVRLPRVFTEDTSETDDEHDHAQRYPQCEGQGRLFGQTSAVSGTNIRSAGV